jgi:hypothetical protein
MTSQLRRLIACARGAADRSARRIEPLLATRYAHATPGDAALREMQTEEDAARMGPGQSVAVLAQPAAARRPHAARADEAAPSQLRTAPISDAAHATKSMLRNALSPPPERAERSEPGASHTVPAASAELVVEHPLEEREAPEQRRRTPVSADVDRPPDFARDVATRTVPGRVVNRRETTVLQSAPLVSISIGRIDVHGPQTSVPAAAPQRRPAFRPGVSLDAFLRRGGHDDR